MPCSPAHKKHASTRAKHFQDPCYRNISLGCKISETEIGVTRCRCMYGLLMLLPQSDAFKTLHARLHSVPTMALLKLEGDLGPLQDMDLPSQGSLSPNKRSKASRQASQLSDAASKDSAKSHAQLVDFEQLLQKFKERQVRLLSH